MQNFTVVEFSDPLHHTPSNVEVCQAGQTVTEWLESTHYGTDIRAVPTLLVLNGEILLEEDFSRVIEQEDVLTVVPLPGDPLTASVILFWVVTAISAVAAGAAFYLALTATTPDDIGKGSTTYDISYRGNRRKPGQPIPVVYGTMRTYPDITGSYVQYGENNEQWLTQIFDVSQGYCDISESDIYYEDTPIVNFPQREIEIIHPGEYSELFPSEVFVSTEVENIEIPAEPYVDTQLYSAVPAGEQGLYLELDFSAPQGIYNLSTAGELRSDTAKIRITVIEFDGEDAIASGFLTADMGGTKTTDPQRLTVRIDAKSFGWTSGTFGKTGQYSVAVARREQKDDRTRYNTDFIWTGLRSFSVDKSPPTTTTRVALRVRNSETVGNAALSKFNVLAKRHLPDWSPGGGWTAPVQTNNAMAAFADILRADYGARLSDDRIDLPAIYDLAQRPLARFNGVFDTEIDVWQALNEVCAPLLARPIELPGGRFSAVADDEAVVPNAMFTMRNIIAGSFAIQHIGVLESTNDSVLVTFHNEEEDYRQTTVNCVPFGEAGTNPKEVTIRGVTTKEAAYEIGIRQANESKWRRKLIAFEAGLDGYLPHFGETLRIHHYLLGLEQDTPAISGEAKQYNAGPGSLTVFEDLSSLVDEPDLRVYLRNPDGSPFGPITCTVPDAATINFTGSISGWTPQFGAGFAGPLYCVGKSTDFMETVKVVNVIPSEGQRAKIETVVDNPNVYIKGDVPAYSPIDLPQRLFPQVKNLTWGLYGDPESLRVRLSWAGSNADYYLVQHSTDGGVTWEGIFRTREVYVTGTPPLMANYMVRVCGVGLLQGPWEELTINTLNYSLEPPPMARLRARDAFLGTSMQVAWDPAPSGFVPSFDVYWNGEKKVSYSLPEGTTVSELSYQDIMQVEADTYGGLVLPKEGARNITVRGYFQNRVGTRSKNAAILTLKNPQITLLPNAGFSERGANLNIYFDKPDDGDFAWCEVYLSDIDGFTPSESTLVGRYTSNDITIIDSNINYGSTYYMRIVGVDVWGRDEITYSDQATILTDDETITGTIDYGNITGAKPPIDATRNKLWFQGTPPAGQDGDYWYDTTGGRLNQWVSGKWEPVSTNVKTFSRPTAPANPADALVTGDMWYDSDSTLGDLYRWNGSNWEAVATKNASWDSLGNKPSDSDLLNAYQQWDQILDASGKRPSDNATKNDFFKQATVPAGTVGDLWYCTASVSTYDPDVLYRHNGTTWEEYGNGFYDTLQLQDGASLGKTANWPDIIGDGKPQDGATVNNFYYGSVQPGTGEDGDLFMDADTGMMYKWEAGAWQLVASSSQVFSSASQPQNPKTGDIWYDEDTNRNPNRYVFRYNASQGAWVKISSIGADWDSELWNRPSNELLLNQYQKYSQIENDNGDMPDPGATKNVIYRQGTVPTVSNGAIWYCTANVSSYRANVLYQGVAGAWQRAGNDFTLTGQLTDDAELGKKADWGQIIGEGKPEDGATVNNIYYSATPPSPILNGDIWYETDTGFAYKGHNSKWEVFATNSNVFSQADAPSNPKTNDIWFDTDAGNFVLRKWDGSTWIVISTIGADWNENIRNQPSQEQIDNAYQQWDDILDASGNRPANKATKNNIYYQTSTPSGATNGDLWYDSNTKLFQRYQNGWAAVGNDYRATGDLVDDAGLGQTANWPNIIGTGKPQDNATVNVFTYGSEQPGSGTDGDMFMDSDTGFVFLWRDGKWNAVATSSNTFRSDAPPTGQKAGDTWFDTGVDNTKGELRRWNGSAWEVIATDGAVWGGTGAGGLKGQPADSALLNTLQEWDDVNDTRNAGKPENGATKSRIYYTTNGAAPSTPSGGFVQNDLWFDKLNNILKRWDGNTWQRVGNDFTGTLQLDDDAKLGETADWAQIVDPTFAGKPENGATKNSFYYQDAQPTGTFTTGDLWFDSGDGFVSKWNGSDWVPVATSTQVYRATTQPSGAKVGDLWYDTDDTATKPLYRLRQLPASTFANWDKIATDGALWDDVRNKPELSEPVGDRGNLFVDGTLDKTAAAGDTDLTRYFSLLQPTYAKLYTDTLNRAFEFRGYNESDVGVLDKKYYKVSQNQYLYVSFRALKSSPTGSNPQLRVGGRIYKKDGTLLGFDYFTVTAGQMSGAWQWYHGSFKITRADSFAIQPFAIYALGTGGYIYVDDLYVGHAPARIGTASLPAFMETLTVDTLYIADNAITVPEYFYTGEVIQTFTFTNSLTTQFSSIMKGPVTLTESTPALFSIAVEMNRDGVTQTDGTKFIQLLRGTTILRRDMLYQHLNGASASYKPGMLSTVIQDRDHGGGTHEYDLQIGVAANQEGGGNMLVSIRAAIISLVQVKK